MQKTRTFLSRLLLVAILLVLADLLIGGAMAHFYFRLKHGEQARTTYVMDSVTSPLLILGSSRAAHHYVPSILTDSFGLPSYNAGKDQQGIYYSLAVLRSALVRYRPRLVILDLNPIALQPEDNDLDPLSVLLPYYRQHPEIRDILNKRSRWEWIKTLSSMYRFNSLPLQIAFNSFSAKGDSGIVGGYIPKDQAPSDAPMPGFPAQELKGKPDSAIAGAFEEILSMTARQGIRIVVIVSPLFSALPPGCATTDLAQRICARHGVPFLDYSRQSQFTGRRDLFSDSQHLDDAGATLFTRTLCSDLHRIGIRP